MICSLDFSVLPGDAAFERRSILIGPSTQLRERLASLPQTLERVESVVWLAAQSSKQSEPWHAAALLRASLADYCAIEEMQKLDRPREASFRIRDSRNPLLHLLELLRHLNFHVRTVETSAHPINITFGNHESNMNVYVISNLDADDLAKLKNGKYYSKADIEQSLAWFKRQQTNWGAGDLVSLGALQLAADICVYYGL